jgi:hypothetical protein
VDLGYQQVQRDGKSGGQNQDPTEDDRENKLATAEGELGHGVSAGRSEHSGGGRAGATQTHRIC